MMKWLKLAKFFISAPRWVKGPLLTVVLLLLVLGLVLAPVVGILVIVLALVFGLGALITSPIRGLLDRFK